MQSAQRTLKVNLHTLNFLGLLPASIHAWFCVSRGVNPASHFMNETNPLHSIKPIISVSEGKISTLYAVMKSPRYMFTHPSAGANGDCSLYPLITRMGFLVSLDFCRKATSMNKSREEKGPQSLPAKID